MQVFRLSILLLLAVLGSVHTLSLFADPIITVDFNQTEYHMGDVLIISGHVSKVSMPVIAMSIYDPDGKILSANNLDIDPHNNFNHTVILDSPVYDKLGEYKIRLDYLQNTQDEFFVISNYEFLDITTPIEPEIIFLFTDKPVYTDGDVITITGIVSSLDSPTVLVGIYDTFGTPAGFYFGMIDSNLEFSVSFLAKAGVNFKNDGTYSIKAHYAESEQKIDFDFYSDLADELSELSENQLPETTTTEQTEIIETNSEDVTSDETEVQSITKQDTVSASYETIPTPDKITEMTDESEYIEPPKDLEEKDNLKTFENNDSTIITPSTTFPEIKNNDQQIIKTEQKEPEPQTHDNLSVKDIALGIMLNQMNLNCDSSKYVDSISYHDGMGPALYRLCKFENSLIYFDQSLIEDPKNVEVLTNKGSALGKLGFYDEAIIHYDQALQIDPSYLPAINNKANALSMLGKYEEAINLYRYALDYNPDYLVAKTNLATVESESSFLPMNDVESKTIQTDHSVEESTMEETILAQTNVSKPKERNFFEELGDAFSSIFFFLK